MTIPSMLHLFHPAYAEKPNLATQVDRMLGTVDATCLCERADCACPWCSAGVPAPKPPAKEDDE